MDHKNKKNIMEKFQKEFDSKGYSLWKIEYKNLEKEGKSLFRMKNLKNFFQKEQMKILKNILLEYMEFMKIIMNVK